MTEPLTLASSSPRRRQLLEMLGLPVRVVAPNIPEVRRPVETPVDYVERLAREKALSVRGRLVLGADTTVVVRDEILEKPADAADALRMLGKLQGRTHQVVTSVALVAGERIHQATDVTNVTFRRLEDEFLQAYIRTGEPMDKAGAYGIQGYGAALVERIEGDFFGVMGLPLRLVLGLLEEAGERYEFGRRLGGTEARGTEAQRSADLDQDEGPGCGEPPCDRASVPPSLRSPDTPAPPGSCP
jgi:septum formation protein